MVEREISFPGPLGLGGPVCPRAGPGSTWARVEISSSGAEIFTSARVEILPWISAQHMPRIMHA